MEYREAEPFCLEFNPSGQYGLKVVTGGNYSNECRYSICMSTTDKLVG
jgi:hypothetical protein